MKNTNLKNILITGANGFVGSNALNFFCERAYNLYAIGHGDAFDKNLVKNFLNQTISVEGIKSFGVDFDVILHCAGSGSVPFSMNHPYEDFKKTVNGTLEVLEYIRTSGKNIKLIYPSSVAVLGDCLDNPISEQSIGDPVSPYGYHKKMVELMCENYRKLFNVDVNVVRLFSVFGVGLKKQLLWDAVKRIKNTRNNNAIFWGTGSERRDFIYIDDVLRIFEYLITNENSDFIVNAGSGVARRIDEVVEFVGEIVDPEVKIVFNNEVSSGNPQSFCADVSKLKRLGIYGDTDFNKKLINYIEWALNE